jgi:hypothetical protein
VPRFGAPTAPRHTVRPKATGVGSTRSEVISDDETMDIRFIEETTPVNGFTGILSRSRFRPPPPALRAGHGGVEGRVQPTYGDDYDPASGFTQFPREPEDVDPEDDLEDVRRDRGNLGADDVALAQEGVLQYVRRRVRVPIDGYRPPDPIRWGDPPFPRAKRQLRFTMRREFEQEAQNFLGLHTIVEKHSSASTSPVRMGPPNSSRLTYRDRPSSYGATTEVLN